MSATTQKSEVRSQNPEGERRRAETASGFLSSSIERRALSARLFNNRAFNMIEIALALAVIGIAMVSILGLFAVGLDATRDATDDNMASVLAQAVVADRQSTPYGSATPAISATSFAIPRLDDISGTIWPYVLYFKKSGGVPAFTNYTNVGQPKAGYYYEVDMQPNSASPPDLAVFDMRISWPANTHLTNRVATYFYTTTFSRH